MKVAYLGPKGSFTQKAAKKLFINQELISIKPIRKVVEAVEKNEVELGVVPIENFFEGEVIETLDSLTDSENVKIVQELSMDIQHSLGVLQKGAEIKQVLSKDQALNQCSKYLCENYPEAKTMSTQSTTDAIKRIKQENLTNSAAIADKQALLNSGFKIISENLCPENKTRFAVIGKKIFEPTGSDKTFLVFYPQEKDHPGTLYGNLGFFANLGVNLEYIQSRPDGRGGYKFYIELDGHEKDKPVKIALQALKQALDPKEIYPNSVKTLGSYKNTNWKNNRTG